MSRRVREDGPAHGPGEMLFALIAVFFVCGALWQIPENRVHEASVAIHGAIEQLPGEQGSPKHQIADWSAVADAGSSPQMNECYRVALAAFRGEWADMSAMDKFTAMAQTETVCNGQ